MYVCEGMVIQQLIRSFLWQRWVICCVLCVFPMWVGAAEMRHVLLLHSYHEGLPWTDDVTESVRSTLEEQDIDIHLRIEYMDTKRTMFDADYEQYIYKLLALKYVKKKPDVLIVSDNNAFDLIMRYRDQLFPDVPILFCGIDGLQGDVLDGQPMITGVAEVVDALGTVQLAKKIHPKLNQIFVINDHSTTGQRLQHDISQQLKGLSKKIKVQYVSNLSMQSLLKKVKSLSKNSIILLGYYANDQEGMPYSEEESTHLISEHSRVPVYGLHASHLGHGIVGGHLVSAKAQGEAVAKLAIRFFQGEYLSEIPVLKKETNVYLFDELALRRFGIDAHDLPEDAQKINQDLTKLTRHELAWLKKHPHIRFAPAPYYPPVEFFDEKGVYRGITADFMQHMYEKMDLKVETIQYSGWSEVVEKARTGDVDMWGAAAKTTEREKYMIFTQPYIRLPAVIIVRKDQRDSLSMGDLEGKLVVVIEGYASHQYIKENFPELTLVKVPNIEAGLQMVSFGAADAIVATNAVALFYIEKNGLTNLKVAGESGYEWYLRFAVRSDWPELASILQKGLNAISEEEKAQIFRRWISLRGQKWPWSKRQLMIVLGGVLVLTFFGILLWNYQLRNTVSQRTKLLNQTIKKLAKARKEEAVILRNVQIGIAHVVDRKLHWVNEKMVEQRGLKSTDLMGVSTRILYCCEDDYQCVGHAYKDILSQGNRFEMEVKMRRGDADFYWCRLVGQAVDSTRVEDGVIWLLEDITKQKKLKDHLINMATIDYLTGVYNRRYFMEKGHAEVSMSQNIASHYAVLMMDIDYFKHLNDQYGHAVGDDALIFFAKKVSSLLRPKDVFGRIGGEEFAAFLPSTDVQESLLVAERVREAIASAILETSAGEVTFTVSIGVSCAQGGSRSLEAMLLESDNQLYAAKGAGRNCVMFQEPSV